MSATIKYSIAMASGISLSMSNEGEIDWNNTAHQSRTQSNACARARKALALGKLNFSLYCDWFNVYQSLHADKEPEPLN
jgi:hypothetical protein